MGILGYMVNLLFYPMSYDLSKADVNIDFDGDSITASATIRVKIPVSEPAGDTPEEVDKYKMMISKLIGEICIIFCDLLTKISNIFRHVEYNKNNNTWDYCRSKFLEEDLEKLESKDEAFPSLTMYDLSMKKRILISVSIGMGYLTVIILSVPFREYQEKNKRQAKYGGHQEDGEF
jgi:hypothetical protein